MMDVTIQNFEAEVIEASMTTPVLVEEQVGPVPGASVIAEFIDETRGLALAERRLLPDDPRGRIEVRRLVAWFSGKMHDEVTGYLVNEKIFKRHSFIRLSLRIMSLGLFKSLVLTTILRIATSAFISCQFES